MLHVHTTLLRSKSVNMRLDTTGTAEEPKLRRPTIESLLALSKGHIESPDLAIARRTWMSPKMQEASGSTQVQALDSPFLRDN